MNQTPDCNQISITLSAKEVTVVCEVLSKAQLRELNLAQRSGNERFASNKHYAKADFLGALLDKIWIESANKS
jgi:hypothetical protein